MKNLKILSILIVLIICAHSNRASAIEAPGQIIFHKPDGVYKVQPDGRGQKKLLEKADGPVLASPDGEKLLYVLGNEIFICDSKGEESKPIYKGNEEDRIFLYRWLPDNNRFIFRKNRGERIEYSILDMKEEKILDLGGFYETPSFSPDGEYWVHSNYEPGNEKTEVHGGKIGEESRYIFDGNMSNVLSWDDKTKVVLYGINDGIYGYSLIDRARQIIRLPFKNITIIAFGTSTILYYNNDQELKSPGLMIYDTEVNEQDTVIDKACKPLIVCSNPTMDKFLVFVPKNEKYPLGEGELYLVDSKEAKSEKITQEIGMRVLREINMENQWSADGRYLVHEKLRLRFGNPKKVEIMFSEGESKEKNTKLFKKLKPFRTLVYPTWAELK